MGVGQPHYNPGDIPQASTLNRLMSNSGLSVANGHSGGGLNAILPPPTNEQNMADLTNSSLDTVKSHSVIYCVPTSTGYQWYNTKRFNSQAYYTLANEAVTCIGTNTQPIDPNTNLPRTPSIYSPAEGRRMVVVEPMVAGHKYVLRAKNNLGQNDACVWNGEKLTLASKPEVAEFFVQEFELNASIPYNQPLFGERPRLTPMAVVHEGYWLSVSEMADMDFVNGLIAQGYVITLDEDTGMGFVSPGMIPNTLRGQYFADTVYPDNGLLPGFEAMIDGHASVLDRPVTYKNPPAAGYAEAIYRPVDTPEISGDAIVVAPIPYLLPTSDAIPRPNACVDRDIMHPSERGYNYQSLYPSVCTFAASALAAKCCGLIQPVDAELDPIQAVCCDMDVWEVRFCEYISSTEADYSEPPVELENKFDLVIRYTQVGSYVSYGTTYYIYKVEGDYSPSATGELLYADPCTKTVPLYMRKLKLKLNNKSPVMASLFRDADKSTCGWFDYEYEDATATSEERKETVTIPPISFPFGTLTSVSDGECTYTLPNNTEVVVPRQVPVGYGSWDYVSCDNNTGYCTWEFAPIVKIYGAHDCFPFLYGITPKEHLQVTTQKAKAQLQYYPAICRTLDWNEVLVPGMKVDYELETTELKYSVHAKYVEDNYVTPANGTPKYYDYYVPFVYAVVTPPEVYHTDVEGTPELKLVEFTREWPTSAEINDTHIIEDGDYWITNVEYVDEFSARTPNKIQYAAVKLTNDYVPVLREPYGAFNDCENSANIAVFNRWDANNTCYSCSVRLDYIPYGYGIPTKVPSCFYKATTGENCAPRMKGAIYDVYRQEGELVVKGACYVPCSSLTTT